PASGHSPSHPVRTRCSGQAVRDWLPPYRSGRQGRQIAGRSWALPPPSSGRPERAAYQERCSRKGQGSVSSDFLRIKIPSTKLDAEVREAQRGNVNRIQSEEWEGPILPVRGMSSG